MPMLDQITFNNILCNIMLLLKSTGFSVFTQRAGSSVTWWRNLSIHALRGLTRFDKVCLFCPKQLGIYPICSSAAPYLLSGGEGIAQRTPSNQTRCLADTTGWPFVLPHDVFSLAFLVLKSCEQSHWFGRAFPPLHHQCSENTASKLSPHHVLYQETAKEMICHEVSKVKDPSRL